MDLHLTNLPDLVDALETKIVQERIASGVSSAATAGWNMAIDTAVAVIAAHPSDSTLDKVRSSVLNLRKQVGR